MMKHILIFVSLFLSQPAYPQWEWQSPKPQGNTLFNVQFVDTSNGWAVGEFGTIIHTSNGGINWTGQEYGRTDDILCFCMISATTSWAVGDNGIILFTSDGGENWTEQQSGISTGLNSVTFLDALNGWAVGDQETILHTTDGGINWSIQRQILGQISINSVIFLSSTNGWAVGSKGRLFGTTDGGATWTSQVVGSSMTTYLHITFADAHLGFIAGSNGRLYRTDNGGTSWNPISTTESVNFNRVHMLNNFIGWIAGDGGKILRTVNGGLSWSSSTIASGENLNGLSHTGNYLWAVGEYGKIMKSTNNGISWINLDSGQRLSINWISLSSNNSGTAVGQEGLLLRTTNNGSTWQQISSPTPALSSFGVSIIDETHGCAVGEEGNILRTTDGVTWLKQTTPTAHTLFGIDFANESDGWIVGGDQYNFTGIILRTTNGGADWSIQNSSIPHMVYGISFVTPLIGWVVGDFGIIYHTTNGGTSWSPQASGINTVLYSCTFTDQNNGWAVGDSGKILHTSNGGATWTQQNSATNVILFAIANNGPNELIAVGDLGTILHTTNGGEHWYSEYSRTLYPLYSIANNGKFISAGDYGTLLGFTAPEQFGIITGTLFFDQNQNGTKDFSETGLAGWLISLAGSQTRQTTTDINGNFEFLDLPSGTYIVTQSLPPSWINILPGSPGSYSFSLTSQALNYHCLFGNYTQSTIDFNLLGGWNLVSLPISLVDPSLSTIFPNAVSSAFAFETGYSMTDTLKPGPGYWIKFPHDFTAYLAGEPIEGDTIQIQSGWNIIGSVANPISTQSISTTPADIISSRYFGYSTSYFSADSIMPGKGYWVKASEPGTLILRQNNSALLKNQSFSDDILSGMNKITISDAVNNSQTLYFAYKSSIDPDNFTLPPLPPVDGFDVRFTNGSQVFDFSDNKKNVEAKINLQAFIPPVKLEWNISDNQQNYFSLFDEQGENKITSLNSKSGSFTIDDIESNNLYLNIETDSKQIPIEYSLMQNIPNPFNPSTIINYQLPSDNYVTVEVYNILGEKIATLVNEFQAAGLKSVTWNASSLPSGVYYYEIAARNLNGSAFRDVKKMILLR
ncbi:MAG: T9SS type A sorting domain-containing protein [Ignavibacteriales bacterium]|nr:T9SS type A sorting domain-containing protein [Ignavibacteriales bacterium]